MGGDIFEVQLAKCCILTVCFSTPHSHPCCCYVSHLQRCYVYFRHLAM